MERRNVHQVVKEGYGRVAEKSSSCCGSSGAAEQVAERIGYSEDDIKGPAGEANLGLGCGNPTALAALKPGEVVVDLGSGAGFDALVAAPKLGPTGRFIGVDMTPQMLERARINAVNAGYARTVEFREGLIEQLPVADASADVVISNCVINLSPDKPSVFGEAYRVLKPGGRLAISDIVLSEPLPDAIAEAAAAWVACIAGALTEEAYLGAIRDAGFEDIRFTRKAAACLFDFDSSDPLIRAAIEEHGIERLRAVGDTVFSYAIEARKR